MWRMLLFLFQDWPVDGIPQPLCRLCGLSLPLVVQVYAPMDNSPYHRTLYVFGCINPNCWNQNERSVWRHNCQFQREEIQICSIPWQNVDTLTYIQVKSFALKIKTDHFAYFQYGGINEHLKLLTESWPCNSL